MRKGKDSLLLSAAICNNHDVANSERLLEIPQAIDIPTEAINAIAHPKYVLILITQKKSIIHTGYFPPLLSILG